MKLGLGAACMALALACSKPEPTRAAPSAPQPSPAPLAAPAGASGAARLDAAKPVSAEPARAGPFNVLLILVDSLRADMPWAGYQRDIAPNLTELERESVSYTRGHSVSSYTAKSVAALLSGQLPSTLKRSGYFFTKYPESNLFFPELLRDAGVVTLSVHGHQYMKPGGNGLDQGFLRWEVVKGITFDAQTDKHVTSEKLTGLAREMLGQVAGDKRFFMYLHYMDPHDQYIKHKSSPDFGNGLRDRYDSEVFYTDFWIGKLLEHCRAQPWWKDTVVIVSADHGEAFGEHGMYKHAFELWNVLTHVPLFFRLPGAEPRRIATPRSAIDIAPTVLELMQVESKPVFAGKSLVAELRGAEAEPRPLLLELPADSNNPERRALIDGDWKLLVFGANWRYDLYNLASDPAEKHNLAKTEPQKLQELKALDQKLWGQYTKLKPFGGNTLQGGGKATGPAQ
jgi:arylsulfatase A-like enzyme